MKQLYATLEDKEKELRDFIRNYEQVRINTIRIHITLGKTDKELSEPEN